MTFGDALLSLRAGRQLTRAGWNAPHRICYMPPTVIPPELVNERTKKFVPAGPLDVCGYFVIYTAAGAWQPGWIASQADMLADDWVICTGGAP